MRDAQASAARGDARSGQAMLEFMAVLGVLVAMVAVLALFLYTFREHGGRVLSLVAAEYP